VTARRDAMIALPLLGSVPMAVLQSSIEACIAVR
jgi:hypothetical protein